VGQIWITMRNVIRWIEYIVLYYVIYICTDNADYCLVNRALMIDTSRYPSYEISRIARFLRELSSLRVRSLPFRFLSTYVYV